MSGEFCSGAYVTRVVDFVRQPEEVKRIEEFFACEQQSLGSFPAAIFDSVRWGRCAEAILAELDGEILGVITLAPNGLDPRGLATLDTLYVSGRCLGKGIGATLLTEGLMRLVGHHKVEQVFCDAGSSQVGRLIDRLPEKLKAKLHVKRSYLNEDLDEMFASLREMQQND